MSWKFFHPFAVIRRPALPWPWLGLLVALAFPLAAEVVSAPDRSVNLETLEAKIQEIESGTNLDEATKTRLLELYNKARTHLQTATANRAQAEEFLATMETAPVQTQILQEEIDNAQSSLPPEDSLAITPDTPLPQVEQLLLKEKADLAAVDARRADFEKRLEEEANRPAWIRQRLTEAKARQEEVATQMQLPPPEGVGPAESEAQHVLLETQYGALSAEIRMLDQELISQGVRVELLKAKRNKAANSAQWTGRRVRALDEAVSRKRREEAEQAQQEAERTRRQAEGEHPVVVHAAEYNARLSESLAEIATRLEQLTEAQKAAEKLGQQIEDDFKNAQESIEIAGLNQALGQVLQEQRRTLPDFKRFRRQAEERKAQIAEIGLQRLHHRTALKELRDLDGYLEEQVAGERAPGATAGPVRAALRQLLIDRRALLEKAIENEDLHLRQLGELEMAQSRVLDTIAAYDDFLDEHLLWMRSISHAQVEQLGALPDEIWQFLSPVRWLEVVRVITHQATHSPVFALIIPVLIALLWQRRRLRAALQAKGREVNKPAVDRFVFTLQALMLVFLLAASWPLVMAVVGWQLKISLEGTLFSNAVAFACLAVAAQFYLMRAFYLLCLPGGVAEVHFGWPEAALQVWRRGLFHLGWTFLPAAFVSVLVIRLNSVAFGGMIGRLSFVVMAVALAVFFARAFHPRRGVLSDLLTQSATRSFGWIHRFWFPLLAFSPLVLAGLAMAGYLYTAGVMIGNLLQSVWMVLGLIVLHELAMRWLRVTRRRHDYESALEDLAEERLARDAGPPEDDDELPDVEEPEADFVALSDETRKLLNTAMVFSGLLGLWFIWYDVLPALRILDQVSLWYHTVTVEGEEQRLPITLADLTLALAIILGTLILTKRFPAVLEIILIRQFDMPASGRYTVITLTNYSIVATGLLLAFDILGASWSQIQWLVAALSVGIGFGLQEIVANFISGIIILFERPVRVGDYISVGETDGTVTRIRIRATTIRTPDGKELLVPNKEFITGRLLNWSLSDQIVRLVIPIGVAYGSDVRRAMALLREAAEEQAAVLAEPHPSVIFQGFGDNSLNLVLRCFVDKVDLRYPTISALNELIHDKFAAAGIAIPFPQHDLHFDPQVPLRIQLEAADPGPERPAHGPS